jgi:hypothetical protein
MKSPYSDEKKKKKKGSKKIIYIYIPTPFLQPPHPTLPKITHKPSPSHGTQETTPWVNPHPKTKSPLPIPLKIFFWKVAELFHPPLLTQK